MKNTDVVECAREELKEKLRQHLTEKLFEKI